MAVVKRVTSGGEERWDARYKGPGGLQRVRTFVKKADADEWLRGQKSARHRGSWVDPSEGRRTLEDVATKWLDLDPRKRDRSRERDEIALRKHILPLLGQRQIGSISRDDVREAVHVWSGTMSPSSTSRVFSTLRAVISNSLDAGIIERNPVRKVKLPEVETGKRRPLTVAEVTAVIEVAGAHWRPVIMVMASSGLRLGEALGLRRRRVDVDRCEITVAEQLLPDGSGTVPPKSQAARRTLTLPVDVMGAVEKMLAGRGVVDDDAFVFVGKRGAPVGQSNFRERVWKPAVTAAGVEWAVPHDLRRHHATTLVAAGLDPKELARRLGHTRASLSLDLYAGIVPEGDRKAAAMIDGLYGETVEVA